MAAAKSRVLVVDDIDANLVALEALLASVECEVVRARSGQEALRELLKQDFALVLLDVQMPEMDGFEVARLARTNGRARDVPIIFVTAMFETPAAVFDGYDSGAVDVLFKPINSRILLSKVNVFLELHRSKQKLAAEIEAHRETLAELEAFNYSVSHDLRAPLRAVDGFARILLEDYAPRLDDEGKRLVDRIGNAAQRMDGLISDLLRLSRIGRARPVLAPLDLAPIALEILGELRAADPDRRVDIVVQRDLETTGDRALLRIALENLLRNAWKFTSKVDHARIEVGAQKGEDGPVFYVRDNGAGFDASRAAKLFAPFQRFHSASQFDGTGIGLAIVQRIIRHHRGSIRAEAQPDEGATFFFSLGTS